MCLGEARPGSSNEACGGQRLTSSEPVAMPPPFSAPGLQGLTGTTAFTFGPGDLNSCPHAYTKSTFLGEHLLNPGTQRSMSLSWKS